ncbi:MAG: transcription termination/antitermination protein NusA [Candidatus Aquicultor primus]|uniref:Transcription termination/antitermination protein NusA n=1 Tax=Candidatus Aquicultor primus TaxID=1797195 RepID=A0A1F2UJB5_9ACTN|nr:MAG: transcription termination/antitermination protein NusA [Candidatus Aquicultor primus]HCG99769.1 transcription termination/antitermination protein NusA [Actinomycetota bacterium]
MNGELIEALKQLEREKQIAPETVLEALKTSLAAAYNRNYGTQEIRVDIHPETGQISVFSQEWVEKEGAEPELVEEEITPDNFGRIAAQTAKQVILQRIREAERENMYQEYIDREGDIVTGIVEQSDQRYTLVNLGRVEALLPPTEQVPTERYDHGTRIKTYIVEVRRTTKEPQIIVSRTHPSLLRRLFELEVPEIYEGYVDIKSVAREPGYRSKIAVASRDASIDPVGACVGPKGSRVRMVVSELRGEKIDVVEWHEDPAQFVANALSPARVKSVNVNEADHTAEVIVPDNQLSLAIGKEGQNARLAAKLTGWRIDIKSESQATDSGEAEEILAYSDSEEPVETPSGAEMAADADELCQAIKSSGERCTNKARPGSAYCGVHKKLEEAEG